jgi:translation initiation factor 5A
MARKTASNLKKGNYYVYEGEPFLVLSNAHSKSGKHGHAKSRIGCVGLFTKKKKSLTMTADTSVVIPEIEKRQGQLIDVMEEEKLCSVMDNENYETLEVMYPFDDDEVNINKLNEVIKEGDYGEVSIEFWTVMGKSFITRVVPPK